MIRNRIILILLAVSILISISAGCTSDGDETIEITLPPHEESTVGSISPEPSDIPTGTPAAQHPIPPKPVQPRTLKDEMHKLWDYIDGSTATIPLTEALCDYFGGGKPPEHYTTPEAYRRLIYNYNTDLIFVTYPSESEFIDADEQGVELEIIPVAKDALVFLVNTDNPVSDISVSQLCDVYRGKITNWKRLGGIDESIIPYQRTDGSGSQTLFLKLLMDGLEPMSPPSRWVVTDMGGLVDAVSNYENSISSIGYSMFYYVNNMYGSNRFRLLSINGVKPARDTIMRGEYPFEDYYYAVMRKDTPEDSPLRKLVEWMLTDEGQELIIRAGYIPLRPVNGGLPADIDPIYLGDTEYSSGTGGTVQKSEVDEVNPVNGVRRPLSDIFYNDFNYIRYINNEIVAWLESYDYDEENTISDKYQIRPFAGIPNDYPHYEISYIGDLRIVFPDGNPFFKRGISIYIPLTDEISPYGSEPWKPEYTVTYEYSRRILQHIDLFTISIDIPDKQTVSRRINERQKTWTDTFPKGMKYRKQLEGYVDWENEHWEDDNWIERLRPITGMWQDYLAISYVLGSYDGGTAENPMFATICFDINTGRTVDLAKALPGILDYSKALCLTPQSYINGTTSSSRLAEGYVPASGSVITDAWIIWNRLIVYLTEPDGRVLQVIFDYYYS